MYAEFWKTKTFTRYSLAPLLKKKTISYFIYYIFSIYTKMFTIYTFFSKIFHWKSLADDLHLVLDTKFLRSGGLVLGIVRDRELCTPMFLCGLAGRQIPTHACYELLVSNWNEPETILFVIVAIYFFCLSVF